MNVDGVFPNSRGDARMAVALAGLPQLHWQALIDACDFCILGELHHTSLVADRVFVGPNTVVHPYVVIEDDVVIGKDCVIRPHALIRSGTVIDDHCVVGHGAEIKHAFIGRGAKVQGHTFVGDSIIGEGARIGTGVVIGNRRFDQENVHWTIDGQRVMVGQEKVGALIGDYARLGANVVTNPGTVIGAYTWVSGGLAISGYLKPKAFIKPDGASVDNKNGGMLNAYDGEGQR